MKFGPVPVTEAEGGVLAHAVSLPGTRFRKGRVLSEEDAARLGAAGMQEVIVARLDPGDVGEDVAADRLARALVPAPATAGLRIGAASTRPTTGVRAAGPGRGGGVDSAAAGGGGVACAVVPAFFVSGSVAQAAHSISVVSDTAAINGRICMLRRLFR